MRLDRGELYFFGSPPPINSSRRHSFGFSSSFYTHRCRRRRGRSRSRTPYFIFLFKLVTIQNSIYPYSPNYFFPCPLVSAPVRLFGLEGQTDAAVAFIVPDDLALYSFGLTFDLILPEHDQVVGLHGDNRYTRRMYSLKNYYRSLSCSCPLCVLHFSAVIVLIFCRRKSSETSVQRQ